MGRRIGAVQLAIERDRMRTLAAASAILDAMTTKTESIDQHDEQTKLIVSELQRLYDRIDNTNDNTTTVIQFIVLVFGAAVLAADKFPAAIVAMPIFWTVWLLYAVLTDYNTMKYAAVAKHLEGIVNERLNVDAFVWESRMAQRSLRKPVIYWTNYLYWAVLNAAAWVIGIAVLENIDQRGWSVVLACAWGVTWGAGILAAVVLRGRYQATLSKRLATAGSATPNDAP